MRLETSRFGPLDIDDSTVITFTHPIIGFREFRRFVLIPGPNGAAIRWLQSCDDGALAFILMDPRDVMEGYSVKLSDHELSELAVADHSKLDVYTLVVVPQDKAQVRTNLKAPIVINPKQRLAKQAILDRSDYPVQFFLTQASGSAPQEATNARSHA